MTKRNKHYLPVALKSQQKDVITVYNFRSRIKVEVYKNAMPEKYHKYREAVFIELPLTILVSRMMDFLFNCNLFDWALLSSLNGLFVSLSFLFDFHFPHFYYTSIL
jgi:hypothetical protein